MLKKILLTGLLTLCGTALAAPPPNIGQSAPGGMTMTQEQEYGQLFMQMVRQKLPLTHDLVIQDYIDALGYKLVSNSPQPSYPFEFFVVKDSQINAFAGPGGHIGINSGLILAVGSEDELAAVMAHEIGHVVQRHFARGMARQKSLQWPAIAAMIASIAVGIKSPQAGMGAIAATQSTMAQSWLRNSREFEEEADGIGRKILQKSGYSTAGMTRMLKHLMKQHSGEESEQEILTPLMSHPAAAQRAAESMDIFTKQDQDTTGNNNTFQLMQIRLVVDTTDDVQAILNNDRELLTKPKESNNALLQYSYALALFKSGNTQQAIKVIDNLVKAQPDELLYQITQARILSANKQAPAALSLLGKLYNNNSEYLPLMILYVHTLLENGQAKKGLNILNDYQGEFDNNLSYLSILARAQHEAGNQSGSHLTRAKLYVITGQLFKARATLEIAEKQSKDPIVQARVSRMLTDVEKQIKEPKKL
jgi:beta-barrel assembly-enhancing protease